MTIVAYLLGFSLIVASPFAIPSLITKNYSRANLYILANLTFIPIAAFLLILAVFLFGYLYEPAEWGQPSLRGGRAAVPLVMIVFSLANFAFVGVSLVGQIRTGKALSRNEAGILYFSLFLAYGALAAIPAVAGR